MKIECLRKTEEEKKECNGGEGCCVYNRLPFLPGCDKGGHKERSIANSPVHRKHWRKENNKFDRI